MNLQYKAIDPLKYYEEHLHNKIRPDGRDIQMFRPIIINVDSIEVSNGSAVVKIGNTTVVCGLKAELCKPKTTDEGYLIPNIDLTPLCSSKFRPGPPGDEAQISTKLINEILIATKLIDLKKLIIVSEKWSWVIYCDVICLDYDGGLIDASLIAILAALKTLKLPKVESARETDGVIVNENLFDKINIDSSPVACTFGIFQGKIISDPTEDEVFLCDGIVTIVVNNDNLVSVHKPGGPPLTPDQLQTCISITKNRSKLVIETIQKSLSQTE